MTQFVTGHITNGRLGHRFKDQFTGKIASRLWDLVYVHYPLPDDVHKEYRWEPFLGFGDNEYQFGQLDLSCFKIVKIEETAWCGSDLSKVDAIIKAHPEDHTLFVFTESARILLEQLDKNLRDGLTNELRQKYFNRRKASPVKNYFDSTKLNVALHVRRGEDVAPGTPANWRATSDAYYHGVIEHIKKALPKRDIHFHLYSEGPPEIFESYKNINNLFLHFSAWPPRDFQDLFDAFDHMIRADILVTATSEFSYLLSHMNPNITITLPVQRVCELPLEDRHIKSKEDGSFDYELLRRLNVPV